MRLSPDQFSLVFDVPNGLQGTGQLQITVTANAFANIYEYNTFNTAQSNNAATTSIASTIASYPDLQVQGLIVSPADPQPGQTITISWNEENSGSAQAVGTWQDSLTVVSSATGQTLLNASQAAANNAIAPQGSVPHSYYFTLPGSTVSLGILNVRLSVNSENSLFEYNSSGTAQSNNAAAISVSTAVLKTLLLTSPLTSVPENANPSTVPFTLSRAGDLTQPITVSLSSSQTAHLTIPLTVTIPAGQTSVTINAAVIDNGIADSDAVVKVAAVAPGYLGGSANLTVTNTDASPLTISSPVSLTEGQSVTATVSLLTISNQPLTVSLSSNLPSQIVLPHLITIPAGQLSADFTINSIDSGVPAKPINVTVQGSAVGLPPATDSIQFLSNNLPVLTLTAQSPTVLESAGSNALHFLVQRDKVTTGPLTVNLFLSDLSHASIPATIIIPQTQRQPRSRFLQLTMAFRTARMSKSLRPMVLMHHVVVLSSQDQRRQRLRLSTTTSHLWSYPSVALYFTRIRQTQPRLAP